MSNTPYRPRDTYYYQMDKQRLGRQLAVIFSILAWFVLMVVTCLLTGNAIHAAINSTASAVPLGIFALLGLILLVALFAFLKKHVPRNLEYIESLNRRLDEYLP